MERTLIALRAIGHEDTKTQRKVTTDFTDCTEEICHEWTRIYFATELTETTGLLASFVFSAKVFLIPKGLWKPAAFVHWVPDVSGPHM